MWEVVIPQILIKGQVDRFHLSRKMDRWDQGLFPEPTEVEYLWAT